MSENQLYRDLAERTGGSFFLGVVGPVRTGKSSFIKRFMEALVIPNMEDPYARERAVDELPQSASGLTIMTAEPKFVPEEAAEIRLSEDVRLSVRLIDCVGYMVDGAAGQFEGGAERMVTTPWFDREVTMTEAAETGTEKVIRDHSSIGIVVTTDGSFGDLPRERFVEPEERVIRELQAISKPFAVLLNSARPDSDETAALAEAISEKYGVRCLRVNCLAMSEDDIAAILSSVLEEFPLKAVKFFLPDWLDALPEDNELRQELLGLIRDVSKNCGRIKDLGGMIRSLEESDPVGKVQCRERDMGCGSVSLAVEMPRSLYYQTLSRETGLPIANDADLISILSSMAADRQSCGMLREALNSVRETGYGVVYPVIGEMQLEEPQIVRQNGKYSVRLRASAPAIHLMRTEVETEVRPAVGGEGASEEIINFLLQGFDGDLNRLWESNIFGKPLHELAEEGLREKIDKLPEGARRKLKDTLQRMINESCSGLICIML